MTDQWPLVFERSSHAMLVVDDERGVNEANAAARGLFGWDAEAPVGSRLEELLPGPERPDFVRGWESYLRDGYAWGTRPVVVAGGDTREMDYCTTIVGPNRHFVVLLPREEGDAEDHPVVEQDAPPGGRHDGGGELTTREIEVIHQIALGAANREIAERLFIAPGTVKTHVRNAMDERGARTRAHLVALAVEDGLVRP